MTCLFEREAVFVGWSLAFVASLEVEYKILYLKLVQGFMPSIH